MKKNKFDLASFIMLCAMIYATIVIPNGTNTICKEVWFIIFIKSCFAIIAYAFFETAFFCGAPLEKLMIRILFGKQAYSIYKEVLMSADNGSVSSQYPKIDKGNDC